MENSTRRRHDQQSATTPRLFRSKSGGMAGAPTTTLRETNTLPMSKFRTSNSKVQENPTKKTTQKKKPEENSASAAIAADHDGYVRFVSRSQSKIEVPRRMRSASTSPSAWALSPGRSSTFSFPRQVAVAPVPKSPSKYDKLEKKVTKGGGVSGVLKYFRQTKKVSPVLEEEYHQLGVLYNRLLQWRFANAKAEKSMAAVRKIAQRKLFNGWVRISILQNAAVEKRIQIQNLKQDMKLYHIVGSKMGLLNEWGRVEAKNFEAVGRVVRKLTAASICLPLIHNAEADIMSVYDIMSNAMEVMDDIRAMLPDMHSQVEKMCFLLTELSVLIKQQEQYFDELENMIFKVASLEVQEISLRAHHIQLEDEVTAEIFRLHWDDFKSGNIIFQSLRSRISRSK